MSNALKARAKRLRGALSSNLKFEVSTAQSLELVAREENYPNWDAAASCFERESKCTLNTSVTASNLYSHRTPYGCLVVAGSGSGKSFYALHLIIDRLRLGHTVVIIDQGLTYRKFAETIEGTFHCLTDKGASTKVYGKAPLHVYDFDEFSGVWNGNLPEFPEEAFSENGFLVVDESDYVQKLFPDVVSIFSKAVNLDASFCAIGQTDKCIIEFSKLPIRQMLSVRLGASLLLGRENLLKG